MTADFRNFNNGRRELREINTAHGELAISGKDKIIFAD